MTSRALSVHLVTGGNDDIVLRVNFHTGGNDDIVLIVNWGTGVMMTSFSELIVTQG